MNDGGEIRSTSNGSVAIESPDGGFIQTED